MVWGFYFGLRVRVFIAEGVPIVEIFTWRASKWDRFFMREGSNSDLLFVFSIDDSKQNATSLLTPVSNIVFDVLSSGTLGFARAIRREDPPLQPESP